MENTGRLIISKIEKIGFVDVYDLHVEDDHSYHVNGIPVHNSTLCRGLDGELFPIDSGPRPPAHYGCRSSAVPVLKKEFQLLSQGRQRSSRDPVTGEVGSVSAKQTYYGWLKNQPAKVQDSIIGSSRGKLLRNGGLTTERFTELQLHKNFKPMTLKDMEKLEPTAFIKANIDI